MKWMCFVQLMERRESLSLWCTDSFYLHAWALTRAVGMEFTHTAGQERRIHRFLQRPKDFRIGSEDECEPLFSSVLAPAIAWWPVQGEPGISPEFSFPVTLSE